MPDVIEVVVGQLDRLVLEGLFETEVGENSGDHHEVTGRGKRIDPH